MGLLVRGNSKLSRKILCISLPPVKTCPNHGECHKTCYALKAWRMYPNVRKAWNRNLNASRRADFIQVITDELEKAGETVVRIHPSGDFYDMWYFIKWIQIARLFPEKKFYAYTKNTEAFSYFLKEKWAGYWPSNFNLISSFIGGSLNYGSEDYVRQLVSDYRAFVCPCTVKGGPKIICGEDCDYCLTGDRPVFVQH
jgi:hypothetical protein